MFLHKKDTSVSQNTVREKQKVTDKKFISLHTEMNIARIY